jgi:tetratricopeptide (TPR) repeat protein
MSENRARVAVAFAAMAAMAAMMAMLLGAGAALGQSRARVWGIVSDQAGQPIDDVTITVVDQEDQLRAEQTTNKKGRYTIALLDATEPYLFRFEKQGYKTYEEVIKVSILSNTRRDFTLESGKGRTVVAGTDAPPAGGGGASEIYNEGVRAFEAGDLELARDKFLEAIEEDGSFALAYSALARALFRLEDWEGARDRAQQAVELDEEDQVALAVLFQAHEKLGDEKKAQEVFRHLSSLAEPDVAAYNLGVEAFQAGNLAVAKEKFADAIEHNPELVQAHVGLARAHLSEKAWEQAAAAAGRALELEPENEGALVARYEAALGAGDETAAEAALSELQAVAPERLAGGFYEQGVQAFNDSEVARAKELFEKVVALDPDHARGHYMLGLVSVNSGDNATAKEHFGRFLELTPNDPDAPTAREMLEYLE